jgi:hypothetical protein
MKKIFQPRMARESKKRNRKILETGLALLFAFVGVMSFVRMMTTELDAPQAATYDGGKTVVHFEVPSQDGKGLRMVYPDSEEFMKLMMEGKYQLVHIARPAVLNQIEEGEVR